MNANDVIKLLRKKADKLGTQKALAEEIGVSEPYLHDVLHGKRDPGPTILAHLGLKKSEIVVYEEE